LVESKFDFKKIERKKYSNVTANFSKTFSENNFAKQNSEKCFRQNRQPAKNQLFIVTATY